MLVYARLTFTGDHQLFGGVFCDQMKEKLYCLAIMISIIYGEKTFEAFNPKSTISTVKHGGGSMTL